MQSIADIMQALRPEPDAEEVREGVRRQLARIRDAFTEVDDEDSDARIVNQFLDESLESTLDFLTRDFSGISTSVRLAIGECASPMGESFLALTRLADVRLRAQGRYYEIEGGEEEEPDLDDSDLDDDDDSNDDD